MTTYAPEILQTYADRLYRRAYQLVIVYGAILGVVAGGIGYVAAIALHVDKPEGIGFIAMMVFTLIGGAWGNHRAFLLKLEAQRTLCQLQIERNTRANAQTALVETLQTQLAHHA